MRIFKRSSREFEVVIGSPWTINGKPTEASTPADALAEIYDVAVYFPITITVAGPGVSYVLEMDEEMNTRAVTPVTKLADSGDQLSRGAEDTTADFPERGGDTEPFRAIKIRILEVFSGKKALLVSGGVVVVVALITVALIQFTGAGGNASDAQATGANAERWQTPLLEAHPANQSLDEKYPSRLWAIEPGEADQISWFAAGVIGLSGDEIRLHSHLTGEEIATYALKDVNVGTHLSWVTEFYHQGEPAVGLRVADTFVALTAAGETQEWKIPSGMEVGVYGRTPTMTNASSAEEGDNITWQALRVGEKDPAKLTVNPSLATRAVDDEWIVQLYGNAPRVALNPVDRGDEETVAHAVELTSPVEDAEFVRHLDAGHGYSMALWDVADDLYLGIHSLEGDAAGEATTFVPAPFSREEATGWAIARGMELTIVGPYAISLATGELVAYSTASDFTQGYGPAAVTADENDRRQFIIEGTSYTETNQIIGYTGQGTVLVRLTDGSVAAYGENEGVA